MIDKEKLERILEKDEVALIRFLDSREAWAYYYPEIPVYELELFEGRSFTSLEELYSAINALGGVIDVE